jgi:RecA-family ATPase
VALKFIDFSKPLEPIYFAVPDFIPKGYLTFLGAREGVGKTTFLTGLLWQMSRPNGGHWLGMPVQPGASIFVNTDAPDGQSRPVRYWLEKHRAAFPDGDINQIHTIETDIGGLSQSDLEELKDAVEKKNAKVIVIDSFMGAFSGIDGNRLEQALAPLKALVQLAADTGAALIVTDHLPKRAAGEKDGDRGIMGSVSKQAQARAVILLTRIQPNECDGKNAVKLEVTKQAFSHRLEPFAVAIQVEGDGVYEPSKVHLDRFELPNERTDSGKYRAVQAVKQALEKLEWVSQKDLLSIAIKAGNLQERQARKAMTEALQNVKPLLEEQRGTSKGAPKEYRLKPEDKTETPDAVPECHKSENSVPDGLGFVAHPKVPVIKTARNPKPQTPILTLEKETDVMRL